LFQYTAGNLEYRTPLLKGEPLFCELLELLDLISDHVVGLGTPRLDSLHLLNSEAKNISVLLVRAFFENSRNFFLKVAVPCSNSFNPCVYLIQLLLLVCARALFSPVNQVGGFISLHMHMPISFSSGIYCNTSQSLRVTSLIDFFSHTNILLSKSMCYPFL